LDEGGATDWGRSPLFVISDFVPVPFSLPTTPKTANPSPCKAAIIDRVIRPFRRLELHGQRDDEVQIKRLPNIGGYHPFGFQLIRDVPYPVS
jgi:hypothetical protein